MARSGQSGNRDIGNRLAQRAFLVNLLIPLTRISQIGAEILWFYPLALRDNLKSRKMVETIQANVSKKANQ